MTKIKLSEMLSNNSEWLCRLPPPEFPIVPRAGFAQTLDPCLTPDHWAKSLGMKWINRIEISQPRAEQRAPSTLEGNYNLIRIGLSFTADDKSQQFNWYQCVSEHRTWTTIEVHFWTLQAGKISISDQSSIETHKGVQSLIDFVRLDIFHKVNNDYNWIAALKNGHLVKDCLLAASRIWLI